MAAAMEAYLHFSGRIRAWRNLTADWWIRLELIEWRDRFEVNKKFLELFHIVYGNRPLSVRRFVSSSLSSILFVFFSYFLLLRIGQSFFGVGEYAPELGHQYARVLGYEGGAMEYTSPYKLFELVWDSLGINVVPDYLSIIETGWILGLATRAKSNIAKLAALDFVLTTLIWLFSHFVAFVVTKFTVEPHLTLAYFLSVYSEPYWLAYVVTTYSTSFIWFAFLFTVFATAQLKRLSAILSHLLESKWVAELPILMMVGLLCMLCWPALLIANLVSPYGG